MPGLDDVLQQLGSTADHFLGSRLRTGAVATDATSSMRVILRLVRRLPSDLFKDALDLPRIPVDVVNALKADFSGDLPGQPRKLITDLRDGRLDRAVMPSTLRLLLGRAAPRSIAETSRDHHLRADPRGRYRRAGPRRPSRRHRSCRSRPGATARTRSRAAHDALPGRRSGLGNTPPTRALTNAA